MTRPRLPALLALLPLLTLLVGCNGIDPSGAAADPGERAWLERQRAEIEQVTAALAPAGLIFEIDREVKIDGRTVRLKRLAVDRQVAYLEYEGADRASISLTDDRGHVLPMSVVGHTFARFHGIDPGAQGFTVWLSRSEPHPPKVTEVAVPVDLAPLRALPDPLPLGISQTVNGLRVEARNFTRGIAVSTVDVQATVIDPASLTLTERDASVEPPSPDGNLVSLAAEASSAPVTSFGISQLTVGGREWRATVNLFDVPEQPDLGLTLDRIYFKGLDTAGVTAKGDERTALGPWRLTVDAR